MLKVKTRKKKPSTQNCEHYHRCCYSESTVSAFDLSSSRKTWRQMMGGGNDEGDRWKGGWRQWRWQLNHVQPDGKWTGMKMIKMVLGSYTTGWQMKQDKDGEGNTWIMYNWMANEAGWWWQLDHVQLDDKWNRMTVTARSCNWMVN